MHRDRATSIEVLQSRIITVQYPGSNLATRCYNKLKCITWLHQHHSSEIMFPTLGLMAIRIKFDTHQKLLNAPLPSMWVIVQWGLPGRVWHSPETAAPCQNEMFFQNERVVPCENTTFRIKSDFVGWHTLYSLLLNSLLKPLYSWPTCQPFSISITS